MGTCRVRYPRSQFLCVGAPRRSSQGQGHTNHVPTGASCCPESFHWSCPQLRWLSITVWGLMEVSSCSVLIAWLGNRGSERARNSAPGT